VTNVTDRGGGYGGGWGESQDEFKRRVMEEETDFSVGYVLVGLLCFIPFIHQFVIVNPEIQSRASQQQQPSVPITKTNINSAFYELAKPLKPFVECIVDGGVKSDQQHDKTCKGSMVILFFLNTLSRQ
jgi:hypothetical protein